ncbi:beta-1,3-galactosyltransferase 2-like isoform X1 [Astyanax mexicanus]|uniref:beta-1,3-galactosyltransferase 2-like isoform X1 n=1 Tax=Astyanax mexicanus TaxID=7994 RepID=UPI0020CB3300|nr:beta-1,3-galactosyltransferase 2-like isoform X1 [Astyanax mexicanus]XP_049321671.1 beta-1,3-galactosyltransferase 2-like isoform X1 [Astyanax mexicanus]XP_049321672.1 beta-1,3-galactosyltransferase 2-like isoform X1 [Astyanax mexicanus]XP_049321673.1 beta-1,3-galactosyltransferase 2-like isoform X1 [Astyanax mexicanus]XP_049321674.1 beta-1,3-galactosyltransferase 2-like isoform X1 [Astyanax mexicanus]XP_049321676.1 beta-1,3-galactosyltransferase 2-like isoform X1 [Astyanax mexicanus]XP_04
MVEEAGRSGQRSPDHLHAAGGGFECRRYHLRIGFIVLLLLSLLIWYYLNSDVLNIWTTMHILYNTTYSKAASARSFFIKISSESNLTIVRENGKTVFTTGFRKTQLHRTLSSTTHEQCTARSKYQVAYPCTYHYIINEEERCAQEKPFLVLMVPVAAGNKEAREIIRRTWGSETKVMGQLVSMYFMLGETNAENKQYMQEMLQNESSTHHDIIQSDFIDSYNNLTIKTMVIMEWLASYCHMASYAMKVDSDIFLNVNKLVSVVLQAPRENYLTGLMAYDAIVHRDPNSKWYFPEAVFPRSSYPPYALGLGYVFSMDLPKKLVDGAKQLEQNVYIEDVNIGLIMDHLKISYTSHSDQSLFNVFPIPFNRCSYSSLIATTTNSMSDLENFWLELQKPGPRC